MNLKFNQKRVVVHLALAALVTVFALFVYSGMQQAYRSNANDPQIEAVEEISKLLNQGLPPEAVAQGRAVDIAQTLSMFLVVYDKEGKAIAGSGKLNNQLPIFPKNSLEASKKTGMSMVTWQPKDKLRFSAVVKPLEKDQGYVVAARSLREVENRVANLLKLFLVSLGAMLVLSQLLAMLWPKENITLVQENELVVVETPKENKENTEA